MSLFDFARDLGRKVFDRDDVAADNIKQHLETTLTPIKNLTVAFQDGVVTLCGECRSKGDRDLAILTAGHIAGVNQVVATELTAPAPKPAAPPEPKFEIYEIVRGDTLGAIAKRYYGNAGKYMRIFEANRNLIEDPNKIFPGQKIRIPLD
jgi:nucleoid-associated protein YgaU